MYMTRAEFARHIGVNKSTVTRWISKGILDSCLTADDKIDVQLAKAILENIKTQAKSLKQQPSIPTNDKEYNAILSDSNLPQITKAQIAKTYWQAKNAELTYKEKRKELVHIDTVKGMLEEMLQPLNRFLDDLPHKTKTKFPEIPNDAILWLEEEIQKQKKRIGEYRWES